MGHCAAGHASTWQLRNRKTSYPYLRPLVVPLGEGKHCSTDTHDEGTPEILFKDAEGYGTSTRHAFMQHPPGTLAPQVPRAYPPTALVVQYTACATHQVVFATVAPCAAVALGGARPLFAPAGP